MKYYVREVRYEGADVADDRWADYDFIEIVTQPVTGLKTGEPVLEGWAGSIYTRMNGGGEVGQYAHGEYDSIEQAREAILVKFGAVRNKEPNGQPFAPTFGQWQESAVEIYRPGRYKVLGSDQTHEFLKKAFGGAVAAARPEELPTIEAKAWRLARERGMTLGTYTSEILEELWEEEQMDEEVSEAEFDFIAR